MVKKSLKPILRGVSLAAIVRDEIVNTAGGVIDFVESTVPFVEDAVIVDTGSVDGTKQALEEIKEKHPNMSVFHTDFTGYSNARNYSLDRVRQKRVLILDADERLTKQDFLTLREQLNSNGDNDYKFGFLYVFPDGEVNYMSPKGGLNPRLFVNHAGTTFYQTIWEVMARPNSKGVSRANAMIKHFVPPRNLLEAKTREWYSEVWCGNMAAPPSSCPSHKLWTKPHSQNVRDKFR